MTEHHSLPTTNANHVGLGPRAVRGEDAFDIGAMAAWLAVHATAGATTADLSAAPTVKQFSAGASNLTYLLSYPGADLIMRRPPKGSHQGNAHDMAREYHVQNAVGHILRSVPRTVALCKDVTVIGTPFYVMERIEGIIVGKNLPPGLSLSPEQANALCHNTIDLLVQLHGVDLAETRLCELDRGDGYVSRQLDSWSRRYRLARTWNVGRFTKVMRWLADNQPEDRPHTLVHNDFRIDNMVLDRDDPTQIVGLLDWELASVGDLGFR